MATKIIILSESYPYNNKENYLKNELEFLKNNPQIMEFKNVYVVPTFIGPKDNLINHFNTQIIHPTSKFFKGNKLVILINTIATIFNKEFWRMLITEKAFKYKSFLHLLSFVTKGDQLFNELKKIIDKHISEDDELIIYSYWMYYQAYSAAKLKLENRNIKFFSRAHGFDLYEYRNSDNYIPGRKLIFDNIDKVYCVSEDGKNYLKNIYPNYECRFDVGFLGTKNPYTKNQLCVKEKTIHLVSCSSIVKVKRLNKLVESLKQITRIKIIWSHIGDGELFETVLQEAKNLPSNIQYHFLGQMDNHQIYEFYESTSIDFFINVSSTEGIPVSIMEALSFGIPIIATDVGGNKEIVCDDHNGFLISKDFDSNELKEILEEYLESDILLKEKMRSNSQKIWQAKFSQEINYLKFYNELL